nr:hypothetical protein [Pseudaminobacter sp.]
MCLLRIVSRRAGLIAIAAALGLGNGAASHAGSAAPLPPPANSGYDSQLGGAYPPPPGVGVISRDRSDPPAEGLYSICYLNAFQTQAEEAEWWKKHHPDLLLRAEPGSY